MALFAKIQISKIWYTFQLRSICEITSTVFTSDYGVYNSALYGICTRISSLYTSVRMLSGCMTFAWNWAGVRLSTASSFVSDHLPTDLLRHALRFLQDSTANGRY